jgi:acyl-coenzyme A synthetase/AMP-(fatty) acid ligase
MTQPFGPTCLWDSAAPAGAAIRGGFLGRGASVDLSELAVGSTFGGALESLRRRSVVIATREQLPTAVALVELDGVARRMVLCTPDLSPEQLAQVAAAAEADAIVIDAQSSVTAPAGLARFELCPQPVKGSIKRRAGEATEWILLTSGTSGVPKLVAHTLQSLGGALPTQAVSVAASVWSTFYDIRRYGGLQIYLRAVLAGSPLVLSSSGESILDYLQRAAAAGVTHISGTPSHWRRALMSGKAALLTPQYVRLSGEVADQPLLDNLRAVYPNARIAHAFASTEAGVAFDVNDGLAGFPLDFIDNPAAEIELKVVDHTLRIRSGRNAARYVGAAPDVLVSEDGYVDTGDLVELVDGRYYFRGRRGGVINVGGLKVYPEEVESVLNADPRVRMSLVRSRRNPITGAVVVADVVLANPTSSAAADAPELVRNDLLDTCRRTLAAHKVPATLRFVPALEFTAAGKLVRPSAL